MIRPPHPFVLSAAFLLLLALPCDVLARQTGEPTGVDMETEWRVLAANGLIGGVSAGVAALLRRERALPAFARGLGGGALTYAGKRIAVERSFGAGLAGRQISMAGSSIVGNAVADRGSLDRVAFGAGPLRGYAGRDVSGIRWRLDVPAAAAALWGVLESDTSVDWAESLSSGAFVFRPGPFSRFADNALPGTVFYRPRPGNSEREAYILAHERVHVLQYDQAFLSLGDPFEAWLGRKVAPLARPIEHLELNILGLGLAAFMSIIVWPEHRDQPWEKEAMHLGEGR